MKKKLRGILAAGTLVLASTAGVALINSEADAAGNIPDTHSATAQIVGNGLCSAAWVGPQAVLTATHCVGSNPIYVFSENFATGARTEQNRAEIAWQAPGDVDMTLLYTPNMSVDYYAPISAVAPKLKSSGQICGMNLVNDSKTVVSRGTNYCGDITFHSIERYTYAGEDWGYVIITQPQWGLPGDSGGPVYDSEGTVHGTLALYWPSNGSTSNHYLYRSNGFTPTYLYVNELRAHGAVVKGEEPSTGGGSGSGSTNAAIADGTYVITSAMNNNKALDVNAQSRANGANVQLWDRNNGKAQRFKVTHLGNGQYSIVNVYSNKSLDINAGSTAPGANVQQWVQNGGANQKFYITPAAQGGYSIKVVSSGLMLDVSGSSTANGANVIQWNDNGGSANQRWNFNLQ